jgi:ATP-dependent Clp protease adapter protein ClpS
LPIAQDLPGVGTRAFALGYPLSGIQGPAMTSGIVCGIAQGFGVPDDQNRMVQKPQLIQGSAETTTCFVVTDAAMAGGMSGGPLVDSKGNVLGMNALIRPDLRALGNYAVSCSEIQGFLDRLSAENAKNDTTTATTAGIDRVVIFNDPMNTRARVSEMLQTVAELNETDAEKAMMQAHTTGRGEVKSGMEMDKAQNLCESLRKQDILVEVEKL